MEGSEDRVGYWITPPEFMENLNREFGFDFDPCPYPRPPGWDGLKEEWGRVNYVNPPFAGAQRKGVTFWVKKAIAESEKGRTSVLLLPCDRWFHYLARAGAEFRQPPRLRFLDPEGRPSPNESRSLMLAIVKGRRVA